MKTRIFEDKNYKAIFYKGKTIRIAINPSQPILPLDYPEFQDVKINSYCLGNCSYCYMDSKDTDLHFDNPTKKIMQYYGSMTSNQRPFQVALGGGEPTEHPEFFDILNAFKSLDIVPNYTTNGMWALNKNQDWINKLIGATEQNCGGVAISCHRHLEKYWDKALNILYNKNFKLSLHFVISDRKSIEYFIKTYYAYKNKVDYFVLLPYGNIGRAKDKSINWEYLIKKLPKNQSKLAFGANFYPYLLDTNKVKVSLYEPEIMSTFLTLEGTGKIYPSSFQTNIILKENIFNLNNN